MFPHQEYFHLSPLISPCAYLTVRSDLKSSSSTGRGDSSDGGFVLHNDLIEVVNTLRIIRASRPQHTQE